MSWAEITIDEIGRVTVRRGGTLTGEVEVETKREDAMALTDITSSEILADMDGGQDTATGDTQTGEAEPETEQKPKLVTWRLCVPVEHSHWIESGQIPAGWVALEAHTQPIETVKRLPEGETPMEFRRWSMWSTNWIQLEGGDGWGGITASDFLAGRNGVRETLTDEPMAEPEQKPRLVTWRRCVPVELGLWIESGQIPAGWVALEAHTQPVETIKQLPEGKKP